MNRGFEFVSTYLNLGLSLPNRKTNQSAGYDLQSAETIVILPKTQAFIPTGIKAYMNNDEMLVIAARSSLFKKRHLILSNGIGIIDADYYNNSDNEGHILLAVYNESDQSVIISKGEAIAQGVFSHYLIADQDSPVNSTRSGGFGSTDI